MKDTSRNEAPALSASMVTATGKSTGTPEVYVNGKLFYERQTEEIPLPEPRPTTPLLRNKPGRDYRARRTFPVEPLGLSTGGLAQVPRHRRFPSRGHASGDKTPVTQAPEPVGCFRGHSFIGRLYSPFVTSIRPDTSDSIVRKSIAACNQ